MLWRLLRRGTGEGEKGYFESNNHVRKGVIPSVGHGAGVEYYVFEAGCAGIGGDGAHVGVVCFRVLVGSFVEEDS